MFFADISIFAISGFINIFANIGIINFSIIHLIIFRNFHSFRNIGRFNT